jgi:hypothetical protein
MMLILLLGDGAVYPLFFFYAVLFCARSKSISHSTIFAGPPILIGLLIALHLVLYQGLSLPNGLLFLPEDGDSRFLQNAEKIAHIHTVPSFKIRSYIT